jgi:hypothetical protein
MKLLGFKGTGKGLSGLVDRLIRFRLNGKYSHTEIMFEPGDGVEQYMPDGNLEPNEDGYWCASSSGMDRMPFYSNRRANKFGGVRFKRIKPSPSKWIILDVPGKNPITAAEIFRKYEGSCYDYKLISGYINFLMRDTKSKTICSEICAMALGYKDAWRYDPCLLISAVESELE